MGDKTGISWTNSTWSPWRGCDKKSPGRANCHAEALAKRWNRAAEKSSVRRRVFPSMCDVFEERLELEAPRARFWTLIEQTPFIDWQILTKRPENISRMIPASWRWAGMPGNIWLGASCENQEMYRLRAEYIRVSSARVRFLSLEPLLGPIDFGDDFWESGMRVDLVIVGGESGPNARPCNVDWIRSIKDQCAAAEVACYVKQLGAKCHGEGEWPEGTFFGTARGLEGTEWQGRWVHLKDRSGADPSEWPADLRVQQLPEVESEGISCVRNRVRAGRAAGAVDDPGRE